jgi:hypothetical protein
MKHCSRLPLVMGKLLEWVNYGPEHRGDKVIVGADNPTDCMVMTCILLIAGSRTLVGEQVTTELRKWPGCGASHLGLY